jgi:glycosyltransferase-like protein
VKVALLTYSTRARGGVVHTLSLAEALAATGADVTVHAVGRNGDEAFFRPVAGDVRVELAPLPDVDGESVGERVLRSIDALAAAVDPAAYDVVHAQDCISANAVPGAVRTVHHIDHFTTPELAGCHERALRSPVAHVCVSQAVADELREGWGIEATVIPNGVDAARFRDAADPSAGSEAARAAWRDRLGPGLIVLAVGGIEPRKGTLDLVEAMRLLAERGRRATLVVAGGETLFDYRSYRDEVDAACERAGVTPVVLGPVPHDELPALVATADAFAFPSTKEGFGLAAMEALAAGTPTVVRDLPVLREVFGDSVRLGADPAGLADALADALDRPDAARRARGRALAESLTWADAAKAHLALYTRLTSSSPSPSVSPSRSPSSPSQSPSVSPRSSRSARPDRPSPRA